MVIRKKTILLIALVCLLVVVGYINNIFTKQSLLDSSNEYQNYEEDEMAELDDANDNTVDTMAPNTDESHLDENNIVDSLDTEITSLSAETNENIEETISKEENIKSSNYFVEYRLSRDKLRDSLIDRLNEIIDNEKTDSEVIKEAQKEIIRIGEFSERELLLEGLIKGKGFEDVLVFIDEDSARVVVNVRQLTEQDMMKIFEVVQGETNLEATSIKIMEKN